jgi:hypothetical protein
MTAEAEALIVWSRRFWGWSGPDRSQSAIVVANVVPLFGALFLGWNIGTIVILYWFECGVVGLVNVPKLALAHGWAPTPTVSAVEWLFLKIAAIPFFVVHYGAILIGCGGGALFLAVASNGSAPPTKGTSEEVIHGMIAMLDLPFPGMIVAGIGLGFGQLALFNDFLAKREYEGVTLTDQMFAPYPRLLMLLGATLASGVIMEAMGSPVWAAAGFVIGKTLLDLRISESRSQGTRSQREDAWPDWASESSH